MKEVGKHSLHVGVNNQVDTSALHQQKMAGLEPHRRMPKYIVDPKGRASFWLNVWMRDDCWDFEAHRFDTNDG